MLPDLDPIGYSQLKRFKKDMVPPTTADFSISFFHDIKKMSDMFQPSWPFKWDVPLFHILPDRCVAYSKPSCGFSLIPATVIQQGKEM